MIDFHGVTKTYHMGACSYEALRGVSLSIEAGEMVAIVGPSGSGKSTAMHIMGLLDSITTGRYLLMNRDTSNLSSNEQAQLRNESIGFIFQQFLLLPRFSAVDNVALPLKYRSYSQREATHKAMQVLEQVGIADHASHKPSELSGGQQQRVAIARALVGKPKLILADEPTGALDTKTGAVVMQLLQQTAKDVTVVIITHDHQVADHCHRKIVLCDGLIES